MPIRRRPPNRLFYASQRQYTQPYRPAPPMYAQLPGSPSAAVPDRPPYDPDTYYECDGGMVPMREKAEKETPAADTVPPAQTSNPQTSKAQCYAQRFPQDEALTRGTLFPELFSPARTGRR